jgi:hypothetical protein
VFVRAHLELTADHGLLIPISEAGVAINHACGGVCACAELAQSADAATNAVLPSKILRRLSEWLPAFSFRPFSFPTSSSFIWTRRVRRTFVCSV